MTITRHIPASGFVKGTWRNGRGVSWHIASDVADGAGDFGWRVAIAEIAASGPFSHYDHVDRFFTLIEGDGVALRFADGKHLFVDKRFVPHHFACDIATDCTLFGSVSKALNLFVARGRFMAEVEVMDVEGIVTLAKGASLLFALQGDVEIGGKRIPQGDAVVVDAAEVIRVTGQKAKLYVAALKKIPQ